MPVQSLGMLDEGNITEWGIKALWSNPRSFKALCFIFHREASPAQPSKGNHECHPVRQLPNASSQVVTEESHGQQMGLSGCSAVTQGSSTAAKGDGQL